VRFQYVAFSVGSTAFYARFPCQRVCGNMCLPEKPSHLFPCKSRMLFTSNSERNTLTLNEMWVGVRGVYGRLLVCYLSSRHGLSRRSSVLISEIPSLSSTASPKACLIRLNGISPPMLRRGIELMCENISSIFSWVRPSNEVPFGSMYLISSWFLSSAAEHS